MTEGPLRVPMTTIAILGLTAGIFILDLLTPLGIPAWLFYLIPILLWSLMPLRVGSYIWACVCSFLTGLGICLSLPGVPVTLALSNRLFGVALFFIDACFAAAPCHEVPGSQAGRNRLHRRMTSILAGGVVMLVFLANASYQTTILFEESGKTFRGGSLIEVHSHVPSEVRRASSTRAPRLGICTAACSHQYETNASLRLTGDG